MSGEDPILLGDGHSHARSYSTDPILISGVSCPSELVPIADNPVPRRPRAIISSADFYSLIVRMFHRIFGELHLI